MSLERTVPHVPVAGADNVREYLMMALHLGRLSPGGRVPSVRRLAQLTGLDRKTVHRAYVRLVAEGLLVARRGSGTFMAPESGPEPGTLLAATARFVDEAAGLGLDPSSFARYLERMTSPRLEGVQVVVTECNGEQLGLIGRDVAAALGVTVRPVKLQDLPAHARAGLSGALAVVTTDCHRQEVAEHVRGLDLPVLRVALDRSHAETLIHHAQAGPVVMVVTDARYEGAFRRLLVQLKVPAETAERFVIVERGALPRVLRGAGGRGTLVMSPLLGTTSSIPLPVGWRRIAAPAYTDAQSLSVLRAQIALLDVARTPTPAWSAATRLPRDGARLS